MSEEDKSPFNWNANKSATETPEPVEVTDEVEESVPVEDSAPVESPQIETPAPEAEAPAAEATDPNAQRIYMALAAGVSRRFAETMLRKLEEQGPEMLSQLDNAPDQRTFAQRWTTLKRWLAEQLKQKKKSAENAEEESNA